MKVLRAAVVLGVSTPLVVLACGSDDNVVTRGSDAGAAGEGGESAGKGGTAGTAGTPSGGGASSDGGTGAVNTGGVGGEPNGGVGGVPAEPEPACGDAEVNGGLVCFAEPKTVTGYEGVPTDVAIGDWDGADKLDVIATTQGGVAYASLDDSGALGNATVLNQVGVILGSGQLDAGPNLDLLLGPATGITTTVAFGDGAGAVGPTEQEGFSAEGTFYNFFVADVAGTPTSQDIVATYGNSVHLLITTGTEGEGFRSSGPIATYYTSQSEDAVLAKLGSAQWVVYSKGTDLVRHQVTYDLGAATLGEPVATPIGGTASQLDVGDFNEDGFDDVAVTLSGGTSLSVAFGDGEGTGDFAVVSDPDQFISLPVGDSQDAKSQRDVKVGDFNGDGHADVAVSVLGLDSVAIFSGDGKGAFSEPKLVSTGENTGPTRLAVGDLNDDGVDDLAVIGSTSSSIIVLVSDP